MNSSRFYKHLVAVSIFLQVSNLVFSQNINPAIEYKNFNVSSIQKKIMINWVIQNNISANYFEVQRSINGNEFKTVALILGPDPKQSTGDAYECIDKPDIKVKNLFYRLKHVSLTGEIKLSETKMIAIN